MNFFGLYFATSGGFISGIVDMLMGFLANSLKLFLDIIVDGIGLLIGNAINVKGIMQSFDLNFYSAIHSGGSMALDYLDVSPENDFWKSVYELISGITTSIAIIGTGLVIMWAFLNLFENMTRDQINGHMLIRWGLSLIVGILVASNTQTILTTIQTTTYALSTTLVSKDALNGSSELEGIFNSSELHEKAMKDPEFCSLIYGLHKKWFYDVGEGDWLDSQVFKPSNKDLKTDDAAFLRWCDGMGNRKIRVLLNAIWGLVIAFFVRLAGLAIGIYAISIALSRGVQMCIYSAISPLAIADLFHNGFGNSPGMTFIKKYLGLCLQASVLVLIFKISAMIMATPNVLVLIATLLCQLSLITKSQQITSNIFEL